MTVRVLPSTAILRRFACGALAAAVLFFAACTDAARDTGHEHPDAARDVLDDATWTDAVLAPGGVDADTSAGACVGPNDARALAAVTDSEFEAALRTCVMPLVLAGAGPGTASFVESASACLADSVEISEPCARCHAVSAECWFDGCGLTCMPDPEAAACTECRCGAGGGTNCAAALDACTGLAAGTCG